MKIQVKSTFIERLINWMPIESLGPTVSCAEYRNAKGGIEFTPIHEFAEGFKAYSYDHPDFNVKIAYLKTPNAKGEVFEVRLYPKRNSVN
jgi:hypothetical protein